MQRNIKLTVSFVGTAYCGWQTQKNGVSVQSVILSAIKQLTGEPAVLRGCGRTDAGVHARGYVCSFKTCTALPARSIVRALCALLPRDIAVLDASDAPLSFNPQFDALEKQYSYMIHNSPVRDPFLVNRALEYPLALDERTLDAAAKSFIGTHDFSAFCSSGSSVRDKVRTIYDAGVTRDGDTVTFTVRGNGFLYNMVRIMTGTLLAVAQGKTAPDALDGIIASGDRSLAGATAKPYGLYLDRVLYPTEDNEE